MLKAFGFSDYKIFLSTRPEEKYVGEINEWNVAENALENALLNQGISFEVDQGGGAFGPKIDIKIKDSIGRGGSVQPLFDFNLPSKFNISYINSNGEKQRPYDSSSFIRIIRAFFGILIEHYAANFQHGYHHSARIISLTKASSFIQEIKQQCDQNNIRMDEDQSNEKLGYKIRKAQLEKIPLVAIIGEKELNEKKITIRCRIQKSTDTFYRRVNKKY